MNSTILSTSNTTSDVDSMNHTGFANNLTLLT